MPPGSLWSVESIQVSSPRVHCRSNGPAGTAWPDGAFGVCVANVAQPRRSGARPALEPRRADGSVGHAGAVYVDWARARGRAVCILGDCWLARLASRIRRYGDRCVACVGKPQLVGVHRNSGRDHVHSCLAGSVAAETAPHMGRGSVGGIRHAAGTGSCRSHGDVIDAGRGSDMACWTVHQEGGSLRRWELFATVRHAA